MNGPDRNKDISGAGFAFFPSLMRDAKLKKGSQKKLVPISPKRKPMSINKENNISIRLQGLKKGKV
jgi:hypothetical protein